MDKPFKTYEELIELMESRGLRTGPRARRILEREGYYPVVNGYKDLFLESPDRFRPGATLDEVYALFVMDRRLRATLFRHMTLCEGALKTVSTYVFCSRHSDDNEAYLDPANYARNGQRAGTARDITGEMARVLGRLSGNPPKFRKEYLEHYKRAHDNVPLWVTMNCLSLTQAFKFYCAQDESTRFAVSQEFQRMHREAHGDAARRVTHASLERTFDHVKDLRNICAHDERLYCARVDKSQSTDIKRLFQDMRTVLTKAECESLAAGTLEALDFAEDNIGSADVREVIRGMGFSSRAEVEAVLEGKS